MIAARSYTQGDAFEHTRETVRAAPTLLRNGVKIAIRRERQRLNREFKRRIPLPVHPFIWSRNSEKQARARRWWFSAIKRGLVPTENGRYARTGLLQKSWELESRIEARFGAISIRNTRKGAEFVVGTWQVPGHERSGYPRIDRLAAVSGERLTEEVIALWETVSAP